MTVSKWGGMYEHIYKATGKKWMITWQIRNDDRPSKMDETIAIGKIEHSLWMRWHNTECYNKTTVSMSTNSSYRGEKYCTRMMTKNQRSNENNQFKIKPTIKLRNFCGTMCIHSLVHKQTNNFIFNRSERSSPIDGRKMIRKNKSASLNLAFWIFFFNLFRTRCYRVPRMSSLTKTEKVSKVTSKRSSAQS